MNTIYKVYCNYITIIQKCLQEVSQPTVKSYCERSEQYREKQ